MSCQRIEQETRIPCVNEETHAALGLDYILRSAHSLVEPVDIVLLRIEYDHRHHVKLNVRLIKK